MIHANVKTDFVGKEYTPAIDASAYVHPLAAVIGNVILGRNVMVAPFAAVRGDEGQPIYVGDNSNVQDGVIIHALETEKNGQPVEKNLVEVDGKKYAVYIGSRVSLAHQVQIHGPAYVGDSSFIGMQSLVFRAKVGKGCVLEPRSLVMGVTIPDGRYVPAGSVIKTQNDADKLPVIDDAYPFKSLNDGVVHVNVALAAGYKEKKI
ncbi:MAG: carbonic anhydrase [Spirochaetes bacterium]|nr:carbonic anhydrase [Spirochaetota bacterium]